MLEWVRGVGRGVGMGTGSTWMVAASPRGRGGRGGGGGCLDWENRARLKRVTAVDGVLPDE